MMDYPAFLMEQERQRVEASARRYDHLSDPRHCFVCGHYDRDGLEEHHWAGKANLKEVTIPTCHPCHDEFNFLQLFWPEGLIKEGEKTAGDLIAAILWGLADLIEVKYRAKRIADILRYVAKYCRQYLKGLPLPVEPLRQDFQLEESDEQDF